MAPLEKEGGLICVEKIGIIVLSVYCTIGSIQWYMMHHIRIQWYIKMIISTIKYKHNLDTSYLRHD